MSKRAVSVTLDPENLLWLQAQARASGSQSLSATLDRLVSQARQARRTPPRSVVGTVRITSSDPDLEGADLAIRQIFQASLKRRTPRPKPGRPRA
jgi:hypothetical protein